MVEGKDKGIHTERTWLMATATAIPVPRLISIGGLGDLFEALVADGYRVIGPTVADGAIVLSELSSAAELPAGWGVTLEPGGYQLRRRDDTAAFGHAAGPQSWKRFLHPPRERLWSATRTAAGFEVSEDDGEPVRYAFLGVRPCDLRAIAIQDRVLGQPGSRYAQRRAAVFIIAVNCTEPGETCFCTSMGTGPGVDGASTYDLALTELADEHGHRFVVDVGSPRGADILAHVLSEPAGDEVPRARSAVEAAAGRMGRQLEAGGAAGPDGRQSSRGTLGRRRLALPDLRQLHHGLPDLLLYLDRGGHRPDRRARRALGALGFLLRSGLLLPARRQHPDVGQEQVPAVAHPQARHLARPVRIVRLRRVRAVHRLVPGRHRPD